MATNQTRQYLKFIDDELNRLWRLGRNTMIGWAPTDFGLEVLFVPQYLLPNLFSNHEDILVGSALRTHTELRGIADICEIEPYSIAIPETLRAAAGGERSLEYLTKRYSITKIRNQAVILVDIVGFSRHPALDQVTLLNSLSYSINVAFQRAKEHGVNISLRHSTTGDGFYVWNQTNTMSGNLDLFSFLMLLLAENSLGRRSGIVSTIPELRSSFHIGECFEYYQAEGARPGTNSFIVGDVTIQLARMIEKALPDQILIGDFSARPQNSAEIDSKKETYDAQRFLSASHERLRVFEDVTLSREKVKSIMCYLTGHKQDDNAYNVSRYTITDKHGYTHNVYNAKVNVHRQNGEIFLGRQTQDLSDFNAEETVLSSDPAADSPEQGAET
ncbi:MAG: hypothetical protein JKY20_04965 [Alphaproteobacteria bacterium]|nr:hypothetical protein [Alphaproteobacteria bacterium]